MKKLFLAILSLHTLAAYSQKHPAAKKQIQKSAPKPSAEPKPVKLETLGAFPYFSAPSGYVFRKTAERNYEEKYFFVNGAVKTVAGKYYVTKVNASDGTAFGDSFLVKFFNSEIEKKGGKLVYNGSLPNYAFKMVDQRPNYTKDLYDPMPYHYKQYRIETDGGTVWVELLSGLNATEVDLTVMLEEIK